MYFTEHRIKQKNFDPNQLQTDPKKSVEIITNYREQLSENIYLHRLNSALNTNIAKINDSQQYIKDNPNLSAEELSDVNRDIEYAKKMVAEIKNELNLYVPLKDRSPRDPWFRNP